MNILHAILYGLGWLTLYGLGTLLLTHAFFMVVGKKVPKILLLTYGATTAIMLVSVLLWCTFLCVAKLGAAFWLDVAIVVFLTTLFHRRMYAFWAEIQGEISKEVVRTWIFDLILTVTFISAFALLERYLPEYDGYVHERMADILLRDGKVSILNAVYRPGFLYFFTMAKLAWPTTTLFFTKYFFPVLITFFTIQNFRVWTKPGTPRSLVWLAALSAPLFVSEAIYFRAQSLVALFFPLAAYALFVRKERSLKYLVVFLGLVGVLSFHIFFTFILIFSIPFLFSELLRVRGWNSREKLLFLCIVFLGILALSTYVSSVLSTLSVYVTFAHTGLNFQSLASGISGPTVTSTVLEIAKYYTHQILFFLLIVLVVIVLGRRAYRQTRLPQAAALPGLQAAIGALFIGALVLPLLGFQYDPERIWIFINILLICLVLWIVSDLPPKFRRYALTLLVITGVLTMVVIAYFVKTRMKTFTPDDRAAVSYINSAAPNALIIGPNVKYPGVGIFKARDVLFYISFPQLLTYDKPAVLDGQIKWLSYTTPESRRQKLATMQAAGNSIGQDMAWEQPIAAQTIARYNASLTYQSPQPQPVFIYVCNSIVYCADPGFSYAAQNAQLSSYSFLKRVYQNSTVTLYRYLPTPGSPIPPKNYVYMEKVLLGSVDLTEYGSR